MDMLFFGKPANGGFTICESTASDLLVLWARDTWREDLRGDSLPVWRVIREIPLPIHVDGETLRVLDGEGAGLHP